MTVFWRKNWYIYIAYVIYLLWFFSHICRTVEIIVTLNSFLTRLCIMCTHGLSSFNLTHQIEYKVKYFLERVFSIQKEQHLYMKYFLKNIPDILYESNNGYAPDFTLSMLRLLSSKVEERKYYFWKPSEPCDVGTHWTALAEYSLMSTHMSGLFASFCIGQISHQQHKV